MPTPQEIEQTAAFLKQFQEVPQSALRGGQYVTVEGDVNWSRIASRLEGEELQQSIEDAQRHGRYPQTSPHTYLTLKHATIVLNDPKQPTNEELYVYQHFYVSKAHPELNLGDQYTAYNKSRYLPKLARLGDPEKGQNPADYYQVKPKYELARDTHVLMVLRSFQTSGQGSNQNRGFVGFSLDTVIVPASKISYWVPNAPRGLEELNSYLGTKNIRFHALEDLDTAELEEVVDPDTTPAIDGAAMQAVSAPAAVPNVEPAPAPYGQQPAPAPVQAPYQQPAAAPMPQQAPAPYGQPAYGGYPQMQPQQGYAPVGPMNTMAPQPEQTPTVPDLGGMAPDAQFPAAPGQTGITLNGIMSN